jgi:hypothetical protein
MEIIPYKPYSLKDFVFFLDTTIYHKLRNINKHLHKILESDHIRYFYNESNGVLGNMIRRSQIQEMMHTFLSKRQPTTYSFFTIKYSKLKINSTAIVVRNSTSN